MQKVLVFVLVISSLAIYCNASVADQTAQAICTSMTRLAGWVYAVRRPCHSPLDCSAVCRSPALRRQDWMISRMTGRCLESLHVYHSFHGNKTSNLSQSQLASKVYRFKSCGLRGCGPNYCCCLFSFH